MWRQLNENLRRSGKTLADEGKSEDEMRAEYRRIAERRVRLGLVIGEIGERNSIKITQDEMRRALIEQARRYPGQEKEVYEYYEKTPGRSPSCARRSSRTRSSTSFWRRPSRRKEGVQGGTLPQG